MKKLLGWSFLGVVVLAGIAVAQVPGLFLTTLTGQEQVNVLVPNTSTNPTITAPRITTVTVSQLRDTSGYLIQVPVTAFSIQVPAYTSVVSLQPAGTLATGTVLFPLAPVDGQRLLLFSSQAITALTLTPATGQTITGGVTTLAANASAEYVYSLATTTWTRVQ